MDFDKIKDDEQLYMMNTYGRFAVSIESGSKSIAKDINGKEYVDFTSGIGVNALGFCDKGYVDAVSAQLSKLQHISNLYYNSEQVNLAKKLCEKTNLSKVFFANSGAEANECAIKLARKYSFDNYNKERTNIITLKNSFHGRTITTLSATGQDVMHNYFFPFTDGFSYANANDLQSVINVIDNNTCAVMIELIQGEGGVIPLEKDFVQNLSKYLKEKDILLIIDEVQTGVSRTGKLFCFENYNITPDILTSAKGLGGGLPIGACLCNNKLKDVLSLTTHGTTYGGNPVACAGANYILDTVSTDEFLEDVLKKSEYIKNKLIKMNNIKEVRGIGLMIGIVLESGDAREIAIKCAESGLLILTAKTLLRMLPPLNISYEEIDKGLEILEKNLM